MIMRKNCFQGINGSAVIYGLFLIIVLLSMLPPAIAGETSAKEADWTYAKNIDDQSIKWIEIRNETLYWGGKLTVDEWALGKITFEVTDFMKDGSAGNIIGALITVKWKNMESPLVLSDGESKIINFGNPYDDEMKITVTITWQKTWSKQVVDPKVAVQVFQRARPEIKISYNMFNMTPAANSDDGALDNLKSNIKYYVKVSLENIGNSTLSDVIMDVNLTDFAIPDEQLFSAQRQGMTFKKAGNSLIFDIDDLNKNNNISVIFMVVSPLTPSVNTYSFPVKLTGTDIKNVTYAFSYRKEYSVKPFIEIDKQIRPTINASNSIDRNLLYVNEPFNVYINMINRGNRDVTIRLSDSVPGSFLYNRKDNKSLDWNLTVPAESSYTVNYSIIPSKFMESVTIPKATARFEFEGREYSLASNDLVMKLTGPEIIITKDFKINGQDNRNVTATITVTAKNLGDKRVSVRINDTLPDNSSLLNGNTSIGGIFLDRNGIYSLSYEVSIPRSMIVLPAAKGYYRDLRTYLEGNNKEIWHKIESNQPVINENKPSSDTINQTVLNVTPENTGNDTSLNQVKKDGKVTKLDLLKNFIKKFFDALMGTSKTDNEFQMNAMPQKEPKRIEETHSSFTWSLGWESVKDANASGGTWRISKTQGSRLTVSFTGTGIALVYASNPEGGIAGIELDGKTHENIDMYSQFPESINRTIARGLENTFHTLTLTVSGTRNPASSDSTVIVDAIEVMRPQDQ